MNVSNIHKGWMLPAMISRLVLVCVISTCATGALTASTLELNVDIAAGASEIESEATVNNVYFVFDRSSSMKGSLHLKMLKLFEECLESLPRDSRVFYLVFSSSVGEIQGGENGLPVNTAAQRKKLYETVKKETVPNGVTLLYDAQHAMMTKIEEHDKMWRAKCKEFHATLYVYTDGDNQTQGQTAMYKSEYETKVKRWEKPWHGMGKVAIYENEQETKARHKAEKLVAYEAFKKTFRNFVEVHTRNNSLTIERHFLAGTQDLPDNDDWGRGKLVFRPVLDGDFSRIESPLAHERQAARCSLRFPMPTKRWNELKGRSALLCLKYGNTKRSAQLSFKEGLIKIKFDLSGITGEHPTEAELTLEKLPSPSEFKVFELKEPRPLRFVFPKTGTVMLSDIEPGLRFVWRIDEPIKFSAKCTDGVTPIWSFSDNTVKEGTSFVKSFNVAKHYTFEVVATNKNLNPCKLKGDIQIIEAGVGIKPPSESVVVDKPVRFVAEAKGTAHSFDWSVDGIPVPGDGKVLDHVFAKSGDHKVQVHARYENIGLVSSPVLPVSVKTAPRIGIQSPTAYSDEFVVGDEIKLVAEVEGNLDTVVWTLSGPVTNTLESPVVRGDGQAVFKSSSAVTRVSRAGVYEISAKAVGEGVEKKAQPVQITVKRADVGIDIKLPVEGHEVENGKEERFEAKVTGPEIVKVSWYAVDEKGTTIDIGLSDVEKDGKSCRAFVFPQTVGKTVLNIYARGLNADGKELSESVVSAPREVLAFTPGSVDIDMKQNFARVPYGEQRVLTATPSGAVSEVSWFMIEDGMEMPILGSGNVIRTPIVKPDGKTPERTIDYFARGKMPDGSFVPKDPRPITLIHYCPDIKCSIGLPRVEGVMRTSFGRADAFDVQLEDENGRLLDTLTDVKWDFGDGMTADTPVFHRPAYGKYDEFTIKASGKCPKCGTRYHATPVKIKIEKQPAVAKFKMEPELSAYTIRGNVRLIDISEGDVGKRVWRVNGKEIQGSENKKEVNDGLPSIPEDRTYTLEVTDMDGKTSAPYVVTIRVRIGGWFIVPVIIISILLWIPFWGVLANNGPAGWRVLAWKGVAPKLDKEGKAKEAETVRKKWNVDKSDAKPILKWWSKCGKVASIPPDKLGLDLAELGGDAPPTGNLIIGSKAPKVGGLASLIRDQSAAIGLIGIPKVEFYRFSPSKDAGKKAIGKGNALKNLRIILDSRQGTYRYAIALWVLTALLVAAITWIIFKFAI